jgi:hypothetical protein
LNPAAAAPTATPLSTPNFPSLSGPSRTFVYDHALTAFVDDYTKTSSFVLYDNGAFVLKYMSPAGQFRGGYTVANGVINFAWDVPAARDANSTRVHPDCSSAWRSLTWGRPMALRRGPTLPEEPLPMQERRPFGQGIRRPDFPSPFPDALSL